MSEDYHYGNEQIFKPKKARKAGYNAKRRGLNLGKRFTEAEKADIIRRMRRFETPVSIANLYGVHTSSIMNVMNERKKT